MVPGRPRSVDRISRRPPLDRCAFPASASLSAGLPHNADERAFLDLLCGALSLAPRLGAAFDDHGDQFFAAADGSSEGGVGPPAGVVLPGLADERVALLPVSLGECERLGRAAVMLAGLLDFRVRWHEPRSRSAGWEGPSRTRRYRACPDRPGPRW